MDLRRHRAQHVRLVQVIGRGDHHRVESVDLEQILDVGERVADAEAIGERARLGPVVIADGRKLRPAHLRQNRQVR